MRVRRTHRPAPTAALLALPAVIALSACGGGHRLADYDFAGRTVAVDWFPAPAPELRTGGYDASGSDDPLSTVIQAGSRVVREVEARRAQARLDSAASRTDIAERTAERTLERSARYLGARPVEDAATADFILEVDLHEVGIAVGSSRATLFMAGEAVLLDRATGAEVWATDVRARDGLTPGVDGGGVLPQDVLTAGALSTVSVADFEQMLERLADLSADAIGRELRERLRDVRRDR